MLWISKKKKNKSNLCDIWRQLDTMHTSFCCFFDNFTIFRTREVDICTKRFVLLNFILFSCLFFFNDIFEDSTDIATRLNGNTEVKKKRAKERRKYIICSLQVVSNVFTIANRNKSSLMIQSTTTVNYENVFTFFLHDFISASNNRAFLKSSEFVLSRLKRTNHNRTRMRVLNDIEIFPLFILKLTANRKRAVNISTDSQTVKPHNQNSFISWKCVTIYLEVKWEKR